METETATNGDVGVTSWLVSGLEIEEEQIIVAWLGKLIANQDSLTTTVDFAKRRQKLRVRINKFNKQARKFIGDKAVDTLGEWNTGRVLILLDADTNDREDASAHGSAPPPQIIPTRTVADPECEDIPMPIFLKTTFSTNATAITGHASLAEKEFALRTGQANDALRKIREDLSHLAWQFKKKIRLATTTKQTTRSWAGVHILNRHWRDYRLVYLRARQRMIDLKTEDIVNETHPMLTHAHCRVDTSAVAQSNARNQRNTGLSWIWRASVINLGDIIPEANAEDQYILECTLSGRAIRNAISHSS